MPAPYNAPKAGPDVPKVWGSWTDVLGQTYRPGDTVAVGVINGRSPQIVIGEVIRINRINSQGQEHLEEVLERDDNGMPVRDPGTHDFIRHIVPSCTVTVMPQVDARGFWRAGVTFQKDKKVRPVTYTIWQNIIKVRKRVEPRPPGAPASEVSS